jgi:hypothetical protein
MDWTKTAIRGRHQVQIDLTYEGGRRTTWSGVVDVNGAVVADYNSLQVPTHHASFPWLLLIAALLLLCLVGGAISMRRRARRPAPFKYRPI